MPRLETVCFFVPLFSPWELLNAKLIAARDRNRSKLAFQQGSIIWRLRRQDVDEDMTKLDTVLCSVPLCSIWDRLNGKLLAARD